MTEHAPGFGGVGSVTLEERIWRLELQEHGVGGRAGLVGAVFGIVEQSLVTRDVPVVESGCGERRDWVHKTLRAAGGGKQRRGNLCVRQAAEVPGLGRFGSCAVQGTLSTIDTALRMAWWRIEVAVWVVLFPRRATAPMVQPPLQLP